MLYVWHIFNAGFYEKKILLLCRYSSVVEHTLGKGGVASPILASGTIKKATFRVVFLMVTLVKDGLAKQVRRTSRKNIGERERAEARLKAKSSVSRLTSLLAAPFLRFPHLLRIFYF